MGPPPATMASSRHPLNTVHHNRPQRTPAHHPRPQLHINSDSMASANENTTFHCDTIAFTYSPSPHDALNPSKPHSYTTSTLVFVLSLLSCKHLAFTHILWFSLHFYFMWESKQQSSWVSRVIPKEPISLTLTLSPDKRLRTTPHSNFLHARNDNCTAKAREEIKNSLQITRKPSRGGVNSGSSF